MLTDEVGEPDCATSYVSEYMNWADAHGVSYLPWGWELWGCADHAYGLLTNWSGTPNSYGQAFFRHFRAAGGQELTFGRRRSGPTSAAACAVQAASSASTAGRSCSGVTVGS